MFPLLAVPPDVPGHPYTPPPVTAHVPCRQFKASGSQVSRGLARNIPRQIPYLYPPFFTVKSKRRPQNQGERNILMDTLIRKAIIMFGINQVFRGKNGFPW
jgi:hypothetical protein